MDYDNCAELTINLESEIKYNSTSIGLFELLRPPQYKINGDFTVDVKTNKFVLLVGPGKSGKTAFLNEVMKQKDQIP